MAREPETVVAGVALRASELVIVDPDLSRSLLRTNWSASSMESAGKCLAGAVAGRLLPEAKDEWAANTLGTSAHQVLELFYGLPAHERTLDAAIDIIDSLHETHPDLAPTSRADVLRWRAEVLRRVQPLWRAENPQAVNVAARELKTDGILIGGVPFVGHIDRVDHASRDVRTEMSQPEDLAGLPLVVIDYKAGKDKTKPARGSFAAYIAKYGDAHGDQLRLYALALRKLVGRLPEKVKIIYTQTGSLYEASLDEDALAAVEQRFAQSFHDTNAAVQAGLYPYSPGVLCGWCPLAAVCPGAASAGVKPQTQHALAGVRLGIRLDPSAQPVPIRQETPMSADPYAATREALARARGAVVEEPPFDPDYDLAPDETSAPVSEQVTPVPERNAQMTAQPLLFPGSEGKPYETHNDPHVGRLDPNSYAATAAIGISTLAVEVMHEAQRPIAPAQRQAVARTLLLVANTVQQNLSGRVDLAAGLHTRIRGALRTVLAIHPMPFGGDDDAWQAWIAGAVARVDAIIRTGRDLYVYGPGDRAWADLVVSPGDHQAVTPSAVRPA